MAPKRILILGGTTEAVELARLLEADPGCRPITSLAGRTSTPHPVPGEVRIGGFGGADGLAAYLASQNIDMLVDATHPFAATMSRNATDACRRVGTPWLRLDRPPWAQGAGDRWIDVDDADGAARSLPTDVQRIFLSIGRQDLAPFSARTDVAFLVRMIEPPSERLPLARCELILARGPFEAGEEEALLTRHRIDMVVSKNSGGDATYGKIVAARRLGLPVVMIARPPAPDGPSVPTASAAMGWIVAGAR